MRTMMLGMAAALAMPAISAPAIASDGGYSGKVWRGADGRLHCRRSDGTTGSVAARTPANRVGIKGERATGTILGAAAGALLGRKIERSGRRCR